MEIRYLREDTTDEEAREIAAWCEGSYNTDGDGSIEVDTAIGRMFADSGDVIIKHGDGRMTVRRGNGGQS